MNDSELLRGGGAMLAALLEARSGQRLTLARSWRLEATLKSVMREHDVASIDALAALVVGGGGERVATQVIEALLNNETSFFRDTAALDVLDHLALERLRQTRSQTRHIRIWSAACSTGQEPYSLALMVRQAQRRWQGWTFDILATDISQSAIARAQHGHFSRFEIQRGMPVRTMLEWFREDNDGWQIDPVIRRQVRFATHDLRNAAPGRFDLILCRNVLMYFAMPVRRAILDNLADALDPGGILMLGAGETVIDQSDRFTYDNELRGLYVVADPADPVGRVVGQKS